MKLKTRTNQPVYYKLPVSSNMQQLSDGLLNSLKVGDVVQKKTGNQKHCYIVTYKEEKHGICLSYIDCGYMETISYDYTNGHWVYNSKDVCEVQQKLVSGTNIKTINSQSLLGSGNINISGGTQLYKHRVYDDDGHEIIFISPSNSNTIVASDLIVIIRDSISKKEMYNTNGDSVIVDCSLTVGSYPISVNYISVSGENIELSNVKIRNNPLEHEVTPL